MILMCGFRHVSSEPPYFNVLCQGYRKINSCPTLKYIVLCHYTWRWLSVLDLEVWARRLCLLVAPITLDLIAETWKNVHEWNDEVQKAILTPNYVKVSFIFPNLIRLKFMLKVLGKWFWSNACIFNFKCDKQTV